MQDFLKNFSLEGKIAWVTGASLVIDGGVTAK